jgi:hypothetical protein
MNEKQKKNLKIVAFVMVGMLLFPPFHDFYNAGAGSSGEEFLGYGFIFSPPKNGTITGALDKGLLIIQLLVVSVVGIIAFKLRSTNLPKE